jgi:hypothetical protein
MSRVDYGYLDLLQMVRHLTTIDLINQSDLNKMPKDKLLRGLTRLGCQLLYLMRGVYH